jgi:streptothricin acetyltransferase
MLKTNRQSTVNSSDTIADNKELSGFYIIAMDWEHLRDINKPNQPFTVFGRLVPAFEGGKWTWTEKLFETPYEKLYPDDELDYTEYINNPDKMIFMAYVEYQCAGQIRLRRNWNKYCYNRGYCSWKRI